MLMPTLKSVELATRLACGSIQGSALVAWVICFERLHVFDNFGLLQGFISSNICTLASLMTEPKCG